MASYSMPRRVPGVAGLARVMGTLGSRGCPYSCKFCFRLEKGYRKRSVGNCMEELKALVSKYRVNHVQFSDELFTISKKRTLEMCEAIRRSGLGFSWYCSCRFDSVDREQLRAMRKAGCVHIGYGLESGDQRILDEMDKRITVEQILETSAMTKEEGILVSVPAMFGLPGETKESLAKTVDLIIATTSWHDKRTVRPMQPYPGTYYFDYSLKLGMLKDVDDFYERFCSSEDRVVNLTGLADSEFDKALFAANRRLLRKHYDNAYRSDVQMFRDVYFKKDATGFMPMALSPRC